MLAGLVAQACNALTKWITGREKAWGIRQFGLNLRRQTFEFAVHDPWVLVGPIKRVGEPPGSIGGECLRRGKEGRYAENA